MGRIKGYFNYTYEYPAGCLDNDGVDISGIVFYVGKGSSTKRIDDHLVEAAHGCHCRKCQEIRWIWAQGKVPRRQIVFDTSSEKKAFTHEMYLIQKVYNSKYLTNVKRSDRLAEMDVIVGVELVAEYIAPIERPFSPRKEIPTMTVGGEEYIVATAAAKRLGISRTIFYERYRNTLSSYQIGQLKWEYYKVSELDAINSPQTTRMPSSKPLPMPTLKRRVFRARREPKPVAVQPVPVTPPAHDIAEYTRILTDPLKVFTATKRCFICVASYPAGFTDKNGNDLEGIVFHVGFSRYESSYRQFIRKTEDDARRSPGSNFGHVMHSIWNSGKLVRWDLVFEDDDFHKTLQAKGLILAQYESPYLTNTHYATT